MTNYSYVDAWSDYRRRLEWFWRIWLGGFAIAASLAVVSSGSAFGESAFLLIGVAWIAGFIFVALRLQGFHCPRCHERFFSATWHYNPLASKCVHCGLRKDQK